MVRSKSILLLFLSLPFLFFAADTAFSDAANRDDCATVQRLIALLPPQVVAFYGVEAVAHLEQVDGDLEKALVRLALYDKKLFSWNHVDDFSDVILECSLSWPENQVQLFERIHGRSQPLLAVVQRYRQRLPELSEEETSRWIAAGFSAPEAEKWIRLGRSPQESGSVTIGR